MATKIELVAAEPVSSENSGLQCKIGTLLVYQLLSISKWPEDLKLRQMPEGE